MVIILPTFDLSLLKIPKDSDNICISYYFINEEKIKDLIKNNRCRTILKKKEIINLFNLKEKVQIVSVKKIFVNLYDKIVVPYKGQYIVLEFILAEPYARAVLKMQK